MTKVECIFCRHRRDRGKEHAWPLWLHECLGTTSEMHDETHYGTLGTIRDQRRQRASTIILGKVCEPCNNGWMSDLETATLAFFRPLLTGEPLAGAALTGEECRVLGIWAWKTAIVRNRAVNYRPVVPAGHFRYLFEKRSIAPGVFVDLAIAPSHTGLSAIQGQDFIAFAPLGGHPKPAIDGHLKTGHQG